MRLLQIAKDVSVAIKPAGFQLDVARYLNTDFPMGVFLDIRCANQNISGIFDEVRPLYDPASFYGKKSLFSES